MKYRWKIITLYVLLVLVAVIIFVDSATQNQNKQRLLSNPNNYPINRVVSYVKDLSSNGANTTEGVKQEIIPESTPASVPSSEIVFVGPRQNIDKYTPNDYGFWSFAAVVPGVLSRSGQPLMSEFKWLKNQGWKSIVDLRVEGERGEVANDSKLSGFDDLEFNYLKLPIADGSPPTYEQAEKFLGFVTDPTNWPIHIHCRGGIGRTGTMISLYRYAVGGWPMDKAIEESRLFKGGVSDQQKKWLEDWAKAYQTKQMQLRKEN